MTNFMLFDLTLIPFTLLVWFIVASGQGFVIGWISNVLSFRSCSLAKQLCLAMLISSSVMPCFYYLIGLVGGTTSLIVLNLLFFAALSIIILRRRPSWSRVVNELLSGLASDKALYLTILIWLSVGLAMLIDVQIGKKLYLSMTMFDHSAKIAIADAISRTGIPPVNPVFFPGKPIPLLYHYYWTIPCSLISTICGSPYNTRVAVISGVLWTGVVFLACVSLSCDYFNSTKVAARTVTIFTMMLLMVSNLYILVAFPLNYLGTGLLCVPSICWWTLDQTAPIVHSMLWVPHYIAGLAAGILGSILLLQVNQATKVSEKIWHIVLAGACIASACGLSLYCAIGIAISWVTWGLYSFCRGRLSDMAIVGSACVLGLLLTVPFLTEMSRAYPEHANAPFIFGVRQFELINGLISCWPELYKQLVYLVLLPVNYLFGQGFILIGAILFWREKRRGSDIFIDRKQEFLLTTAGSSLLLSSFLRSNYVNNDLGWRVVMLSSFVFLLWSGQLLAMLYQQKKRIELSGFNWLIIAIGLSTFVYALYLDRTAARVVTRGDRCYAARSLYKELNERLSPNLVIQHNPNSDFIDLVTPCLGLYSHHQAAASDYLYGLNMGGDHQQYLQVAKEVTTLFNNPTTAEALNICRRYKIDVIVITDTDPIWSIKSAWIWKLPVFAANSRARAYLIPKD